VWFLVIVLAVVASAGEFQHRTVRTSVLAVPRRGAGLAAKGAVAAAMGALLTVLGAAACLGGGLVTAVVSGTSLPVGSGADYASAAGSVALGSLWAVLATGLGMLTRSTAIAITAVLIWRFVAEGIIPIVTRNPGLSRWTPSGAGDAVVGLGGSNALPVAAAAALLLGYAAAVCGAAALRYLRSDPV
jgi:ABC-2 type transport system permease protein